MDAGNLNNYVKHLLRRQGFPLIGLQECKHEGDFFAFSIALGGAIDNNKHGPYVDKRTADELIEEGARAFLSEDRKAGVVVWPDGNIGAVFKDERSQYGRAVGELILTAISVGGNKLDCYGVFLSNLYSMFGFIPVARVKFDWRYAPENWREDLGEPDVIFMIHCGESVETVARKIESRAFPEDDISQLPCFDSYEEAYQYRDNYQVGKV